MRKTSIGLQELRRKIYSKAKTEKGWRRWSREDIYVISTRKQPQADRCICLVAKRTGKPYELCEGRTYVVSQGQASESQPFFFDRQHISKSC